MNWLPCSSKHYCFLLFFARFARTLDLVNTYCFNMKATCIKLLISINSPQNIMLMPNLIFQEL